MFRKIIYSIIVLTHMMIFFAPPWVLAATFAVFDKDYIKLKSTPETVTDTFTVLNPNTTWTLQAVNGNPQDNIVKKVSSATLTLNGTKLLKPQQFNQKVDSIQVPINQLLPNNSVTTTLKSQPGAQLNVKIIGEDNTPPSVEWLLPADGVILNTQVVSVQIQFNDDISGLDPVSVEILLDGVPVTSGFTPFTEPTLNSILSANLQIAEGTHTLSAQVSDLAGNQSQGAVTFTTDLSPPVISNVTPADGSEVNNSQPNISAIYSDAASGINTNSVILKLDNVNVTAQATVTASQVSFTPTGVLAEGAHSAEFFVNDQAGNLTTVQTNFTVSTLQTSGPPVLTPVGNRSVDLGTTLTLPLSASDPDGNALTFFVSPLPLPNNASLNAVSGIFTFTPALEQVGLLTLAFTVSDGIFTDSETITITVEAPPVGGITGLTGRVLDTNDFVNGIETPVAGAVISLLGTGFSVNTDSNGNFNLSGIPSGSQLLDIDSTTALPAPDGSPYSGFREKIEIIEGVVNVVDRPFFLPRIAVESLTTVNPGTTTMVENPSLGVMMEVPPFTAVDESGNFFTGELSISPVPEALAPAALPEELEPGLLITIQPVGVIFDTPVPITFPNIDNLLPGSEVDIWSLAPETGGFIIVGIGQVTPDGHFIETISGGIRAADWHFLLPPGTRPDPSQNNPDNNSPELACSKRSGSQTTLCSGNLIEDHTLSS